MPGILAASILANDDEALLTAARCLAAGADRRSRRNAWKTENEQVAAPRGVRSPGRAMRSAFSAAASLAACWRWRRPSWGSTSTSSRRSTTARPRASRAKTWVATFDDQAALKEFAASIVAATIEFENVPVAATDLIEAEGKPVRPNGRTLARGAGSARGEDILPRHRHRAGAVRARRWAGRYCSRRWTSSAAMAC